MAPKIREANCGSRSWNRLPCVLFSRENVSPSRAFTVAPASIWEHNGSRGTTPRGLTQCVTYRSDVIVTFLCYGTIGIMWHCDHQSKAKKVWLTLIAFVYVLLACEHIDIGTPWILVCKQDGPGSCYQNNATSCRNIEPILVFKV